MPPGVRPEYCSADLSRLPYWPKTANGRAQNYNPFRSMADCCNCSSNSPPEISSKSPSTLDLAPSTAWRKCCNQPAGSIAPICNRFVLLPWPMMTIANCGERSIPLWIEVSSILFPSNSRRRDCERQCSVVGGQQPRRLWGFDCPPTMLVRFSEPLPTAAAHWLYNPRE